MFTFPLAGGGIEYDNAYVIGAGDEAILGWQQAKFEFIKLNQGPAFGIDRGRRNLGRRSDFDLL
jgi:hypothetical protein